MRGTRRVRVGHIGRHRIIPAHAGNSPSRHVSYASAADHPRACGELVEFALFVWSNAGSSPRMRGTRQDRECCLRQMRIIPAHAGNSAPDRFASSRMADHPRACGELTYVTSHSIASPGSSPRMRGTHPSVETLRGSIRIIPAHAGNSARNPVRAGSIADHPRACGELLFMPLTP